MQNYIIVHFVLLPVKESVNSIGGVVGFNSPNAKNLYVGSKIIASYANQCTIGTSKVAFSGMANIVGLNTKEGVDGNGTVTQCYYTPSGSSPFGGYDTADNPDYATDWTGAADKMNDTIEAATLISGATKYYWNDDLTGTIFSTTKP